MIELFGVLLMQWLASHSPSHAVESSGVSSSQLMHQKQPVVSFSLKSRAGGRSCISVISRGDLGIG